MRKDKGTARRDGQRAVASTAEQSGNGKWRTIRRKGGEVVLRSPSGKDYRGTAAEVRAAAFMPDGRKRLAESLKLYRLAFRDDVAARLELCAEARREAVMFDAFDVWHDVRPVELPYRLAIEATAAARARGVTLADFVADAVGAAIAGTGGLDLTRHERAALARLDAKDTGQGKEVAA